jgi:hypothetical protein
MAGFLHGVYIQMVHMETCLSQPGILRCRMRCESGAHFRWQDELNTGKYIPARRSQRSEPIDGPYG